MERDMTEHQSHCVCLYDNRNLRKTGVGLKNAELDAWVFSACMEVCTWPSLSRYLLL